MIFRWVYHPALKPYERLMMVLFEMGMATLEDLSVVMGHTEDRLFRMYKQIRNILSKEEVDKLKRELKEISAASTSNDQKTEQLKEVKKKIKEIRIQWAKAHRQTVEHRGSNSRLYSLGEKGVEYCMTIMHERGSWNIRESQKNHYNGVNKILTRLIKAFGSNHLKWYYSSEATDVLVRIWEVIKQDRWRRDPKLARKERREMIRPDGLCIIANNHPYWFEFDNDTEKSKQLIEKFRSYRNTISPKQAENINYPVIWVTTSQYRRDEMENIWVMVREEYYVEKDVPEMYFFVQGDETEWLKERHRDYLG